tara:strand:+ start:4487 stop:4603 length:117 start_codon:yes stop_codon:yes gene_type:complete
MPNINIVVLPSPLTPKSIEEIQGLAHSHAKEIVEALIQ